MKKILLKPMRVLIYLEVIFLLFINAGCASKPSGYGAGNLCGLMVDENNKPVKNAIVSCWKGPVCIESVMTNENGVFTFYNLPSVGLGSLKIIGKKNGYANFLKEHCSASDYRQILCCQMLSLDSVLDLVEEKYLCGNFEECIDLLEKVSAEKRSREENVLLYYKASVAHSWGNQKIFDTAIKRLKENCRIDENHDLNSMINELTEMECKNEA